MCAFLFTDTSRYGVGVHLLSIALHMFPAIQEETIPINCDWLCRLSQNTHSQKDHQAL